MPSDPQAKPSAGPSPTTPAAGPIIGIDLGTTNSLVAHCTEAGPVILESPAGERSLPSVVRLIGRGDHRYDVEAIGAEARQHAIEHPTRTLSSVKRLMGRSAGELGDELKHLPYEVVEGSQQTARVRIPSVDGLGPVTVTPQEVSALILAELKSWAEAALSTQVSQAVITVPAYFDDAQRQATRDAGRLAGLEVRRIVNEPTAAALAYGLGLRDDPSPAPPPPLTQTRGTSLSLNTKINPAACAETPSASDQDSKREPAAPKTIAVYDLGGGTFDISLLRLQPTEQGSVDQVLATDGDTHLGGDDFDLAIIELIQAEVREQLGEPGLEFPPATRQAFRTLAEQVKIRLSTQDSAELEIELAGLGRDAAAAPVYRRTLGREEFEQLIAPLITRSLDACRKALRAGKLTAEQIDEVILVGGSTRIPRVRQAVAELFGQVPYTALNPDEVVALGASVQAAVLAGIHRDTLLLDVIPLSLGIETMGGAVAKLIVANSTIPARATETFSTYAEGQTKVKIHVLQGERELVKDCRSLATFDLTGIPPMPAGLPKIQVTFLVDANGILSVQAVEERSGRRAQVQVVPNHGLTRQEIAEIEAESFEHAREDMNAHRLIDLRLNARLDLRNIQKQLDRFADAESPDASLRLDPDYRGEIEDHMRKVERFIDTADAENDADAFQKALHDLDHATLRLAELNIARTLREDADTSTPRR